MDDNRCASQTQCPEGNCVGCHDKKIWCLDPRCYPYCPSCSGNVSFSEYPSQPNDTIISHTEDIIDVKELLIWGLIVFFISICLIIVLYTITTRLNTPDTLTAEYF